MELNAGDMAVRGTAVTSACMCEVAHPKFEFQMTRAGETEVVFK